MQSQSLTTTPTLLTVNQFAEKHAAFTPASLRYMIFNASQNGMSACLRRIGRRVLIDEARFFEWIEQTNQ